MNLSASLPTHTLTTPSTRHSTASPHQQTFPQPSAVRLQALVLMLWLGGVWCVGEVMVSVCIYGSICITPHSHPHHSFHTTLHRLSSSANLPTAISWPSASSGADAMARWCVVCWGSNGECMYLWIYLHHSPLTPSPLLPHDTPPPLLISKPSHSHQLAVCKLWC